MIARMREINVVVPPLTPEQVAEAQDKEIESNRKLIAEAKVTLD